MIVGLAGKKQVGKSTAAGFLAEAGFVRASFAQPMKDVAEHILMCMGFSSDEVAYFEDNKAESMPVINVSMRHFLQSLGTDWGRGMIHPDLWVMAAARRIELLMTDGVDLVVEDVRFENEAAFIRQHGGKVVHIERKTGYTDTHVSEAGIRFRPGDVTICNSHLEIDVFRSVVLAAVGVDAPHPPKLNQEEFFHAN